MAELIVIGFKNDMFKATQVLNKLGSMNDGWVVDLKDAVAVYRDNRGELRLDQSYLMTTGEGAGWGAWWGSMIGALLAAPLTAGASAAAAAGALAAGALSGGALGATAGAIDASWWREDFGISEDFIRDVSVLVRPGDSAIFALLRSADPKFVAGQMNGFGGTVIRTSLTRDQEAKVQQVLDGKGFQPPPSGGESRPASRM